MFTQLNGDPVWVESTQVQIIKLHGNECGFSAKSIIRVLSTTLCLREKPEVVRDKIEKAK